MDTLIYSATRALRSLLIPRILLIVGISVLINLILIALMAWGLYELFSLLTFSWLEDLPILTIAGPAMSLLTSLFFFPLLLPLIISFFSDPIGDAIEHEEYPHLPKSNPPFWPTLGQDIRFTLKVIGLNILVLPLYLIPGINILLYYFLNSYLLGSEFFLMATRRHLPYPECKQLQKRYRGRVVLGGMVILLVFTLIPFVNLLAPVWGIAMMIHLSQAIQEKERPIKQIAS